mmetsp:Transcript_68746/g.163752  ORF Transcript_68746/g.163752 Transcript_68746/m.163752 type:complete len:212 (+) Transcript_68746:315-950(+)
MRQILIMRQVVHHLAVRLQAIQGPPRQEVHVFEVALRQAITCLAGQTISLFVALHVLVAVLLQQEVVAIVQGVGLRVEGIKFPCSQGQELASHPPATGKRGNATGAFCLTCLEESGGSVLGLLPTFEVDATVREHLTKRWVRRLDGARHGQLLEDIRGHSAEVHVHSTPCSLLYRCLDLSCSRGVYVNDPCKAEDAVLQASLVRCRCKSMR